MRKIWFSLLVMVVMLGCGSSSSERETVEMDTVANDSNLSPLPQVAEMNNTTTEEDEEDPYSLLGMGKAQLGVMSEAQVDLYRLDDQQEWQLLSTEITSEGESIKSIGNFDLHRDRLEDDGVYLYTVSGGNDWDVEDDGIINPTPTVNLGEFHLLARGDQLKQSAIVTVTAVSEILYQSLKEDLMLDIEELEEKMRLHAQEIIQTDLTGDGIIDLLDVLQYNPVEDQEKLSVTYQANMAKIIDNILQGRAFDFEASEFTVFYEGYAKSESGIQEALDAGDYDYVIAELLLHRDLYYDLSDDKVDLNIAAAYVGKSGYTVFDITGAIAGSEDGLNGFVANTTKENDAVYTINQLKEAEYYYNRVIDGVDCEHNDTLTPEQESACFSLGLVKLTALSNSVKLLFGGDEATISAWAEGVDLNGTNDLNGNGVIDAADASACAIVYASDPANPCRDGSMATYRKRVTFTQSGIEYPTTLIDVDVGNPNLGYTTFKKLLTNKESNNSTLLTDGVCDVTFHRISGEIDGITYFPCPVINEGEIMNLSEELTDARGVQTLFPLESETHQTIEHYLENITGSKDGDITQDDLGVYLQSH